MIVVVEVMQAAAKRVNFYAGAEQRTKERERGEESKKELNTWHL